MDINLKQKRIGVLMGGLSKEREVSLRSGKGVSAALRRRGHSVLEIDVDRDVALKIRQEGIESAIVMLHGRWGEDGTIQGLLEVMGIPYSGSGPLASAIAMDKNLTKQLIAGKGIPTPDWKAMKAGEGSPKIPFPLPVVVKPNREGSTIGVTIVRQEAQFLPAFKEAARYDETILVERFIQGQELTVGLIDGKALPVLEIVPKVGFYDFNAKYTKGMTEYIVPARISEEQRREVTRFSEEMFRCLNLSGVVRTDAILADRPYFLEVNTIPGMTETSLVPKAAEAVGISYDDLCERILKGVSLKV